MGPGASHTCRAILFGGVPFLPEKLAEPSLAIRERRLRDLPGELDPMLLGHLVQNCNGRTVPKEDALGVDGYGIVQLSTRLRGRMPEGLQRKGRKG